MSKHRGGPRPLLTPITMKTGKELEWPEGERLFYTVARDGLYLCRDHEFFRSCVKTSGGPSELEAQAPFLLPRFPRIPRSLLERVVGFFERVADLHNAEAAVILAWDRTNERVRLIVPRQSATVYETWSGYRYPVGVHYDPPSDVPADWVPFGDIHSHVDYAAYASHTDKHDEEHSAGLHIVVGHIHDEPPEFHIEAVVDGARFLLEREQVLEGYEKRRTNIPKGWIDLVEIEPTKWSTSATLSTIN